MTRLVCGLDDPRVFRAAERLIRTTPNRGHGSDGMLEIVLAPQRLSHPDAHRLVVQRDAMRIEGASPAACFHALQTLEQLAHGASGELPCAVIEDWPDFSTRGLLHDVTRGKVPTLGTLKLLADRLASLKANQLQLYIEHAFTFAFDGNVCPPGGGLTPDEVRELEAYCGDRFIDLVPAVATLGHMGRVLSLPQYRHLAEIAPLQTWEQMPWPQRARGLTLDIFHAESRALVERIWGEILDAFRSPVVNVCGDEPWDMGKGKNKDRFTTQELGEAYVEHLRWTQDLCAKRGRRTQMWGDVVRNHPNLLHRLPRDMAVLHWGYDDRADYEGTAAFVGAGLETIVCPGTSGWKRILNAMGLAERNVSTFAQAGLRHGARGLLNTDWGDHGHFNALACSWHGIALGAACAWRADHPIGDDFDGPFSRWLFAARRGADPLIARLRRASRPADRCETWRLFWSAATQVTDDSTLPTLNEADEAAYAAREAEAILDRMPSDAPDASRDADELRMACRFTDLFAEKIRLLRDAEASSESSSTRWRAWSDRVASAVRDYAECWSARYKLAGLEDILCSLADGGVDNPFERGGEAEPSSAV